ncbi:MAG: SUMF1/EgtB/PvdO family nonheme iron enzyme [Anaerolineae bacterium]|nr:SUMF1/EgtB/PvdO family nonheme iron enzyme [Anaerolineae bacterium]
MRLFISYARVDKPFCIQIVDMLEVHETWYDQRLYAGQNWWKEILRRLDWCEGFVYLLSHDSVASDYCIKEFELARSLNRPIFPVLIEENVQLPEGISEIQYVDFTHGATSDAVRMLLNSIYKEELRRREQRTTTHPGESGGMKPLETEQPVLNSAAVIGNAAEAMANGHFDKAVYLLRQARQNNFQSQFINLDLLLAEAEQGLARQMYLREAAREYKNIADLMKYKPTQKMGCNAFKAFQEVFPDYDPENLARACEQISGPRRFLPALFTRAAASNTLPQIPLLEWVTIPAGNLILNNGRQPDAQLRQVYLDSFAISKYPVTNEQYQLFLDSPNGYADMRWWAFSRHALEWRRESPTPVSPQYKGAERPRENVSWYDAMAYANWLSKYLGFPVRLPTVLEWMRAARGDDQRIYPWGNTFSVERANTKESKLRMTSQVTSYPGGASPFQVMDMAGNIWEWCLNGEHDATRGLNVQENVHRAVHGGSHIGPENRAQITFRYHLQPRLQYGTVGFRLVRPLKK